jgi:tripartite-type tricarboxylate transporter receptor subunit TctC
MSFLPNVLLVRNDFPAKTLAEFMTQVKTNPGKFSYASHGHGTTSHLTAELFNRLTGAKLVHVPYKGTSPALNDLIAGHVDLSFMQFEASLPEKRASWRCAQNSASAFCRIFQP